VGRPGDLPSKEVFDDWRRQSSLSSRWLTVTVPGHIPPIRAGLEAAESDLVAFIDDDAEPLPDWLKYLTAPFRDGSVACVGGQYIVRSLERPDERVSRARDCGRLRWYGRFRGDFGALPGLGPVEADGVLEGTSCWATAHLRGLVFDPVFGLDDSLYYGLDLCLQLKELGLRVLYQPFARAVHHLAPRVTHLPRNDREARAFIAGRNYTYLGLLRFRGIRRLCFLPWWILVGDRQSYGWLKALWDMVFHRKGTRRVALAAWRGRREGLRVWRRRRTSRVDAPFQPA
jgi:cellulose synthase/poly-beta-1,6-N-acetylglucosamine synthase-like glycosyltransferase